jgi:hypothetical protein
VELGNVVPAKSFDDEHLKYMKASRFTRTYPNVEAMAKAGVVRVATLASDLDFNKMDQALP